MTAPDSFFRAYVECALWSSTDWDSGEPLDDTYDTADIAPETLDAMRADCDDFYAANVETWQAAGMSDDQAGHDFWLTRNRHGAGFWDHGIGDAGRTLTANAHAYGECDLYVGDDGRVYA
jgi:hypothetical protein